LTGGRTMGRPNLRQVNKLVPSSDLDPYTWSNIGVIYLPTLPGGRTLGRPNLR
jgi:hypothetical protein